MAHKDLKDLIASTVIELDGLETKSSNSNDELLFLGSLKERLLIFFEALQSDELVEGDKKLNVTINYLEYMLSIIELRIKKVDKGN